MTKRRNDDTTNRTDDEKTTQCLLTIIFSILYLFSSLGLLGWAFGVSLRGFLLA